jgi:hypothetical protein
VRESQRPSKPQSKLVTYDDTLQRYDPRSTAKRRVPRAWHRDIGIKRSSYTKCEGTMHRQSGQS